MSILIHPSYFGNIATWVAISRADKVVFEVHDSYQKQTYRNRAYIYGANGKMALNVPVSYTQKNRQYYRDVEIANDGKWQTNQWKSLQSAYKTSPYFEYYEHELLPIFKSKHGHILDLNFKCVEIIAECLQLEISFEQSSIYERVPKQIDLRKLINARKEPSFDLQKYTQVFSSKHGFISNLSILDLLFNEGPNSLNYLESQSFEKIRAALP